MVHLRRLYRCYCDYPENDQHECLSYQRRYETCNYCQNQGHCIRGDLTNRTDFACLCPDCVTAVLCQFSSNPFSISLDLLIAGNDSGRGHLIAPSIVLFIGAGLTVLSVITFIQPLLRQSGIVIHLLSISFFSLIVLIFLFCRVTYLYMVRRIIIAPELSASMCKSLPLLMHTFYSISLWLMATITVERAIVAVQYSRWGGIAETRIILSIVQLGHRNCIGFNVMVINQYELTHHPAYF